jgi:hypothetical protein
MNLAQYTSAAVNMRPGDVIACQGTALISKAIETVTKSPITHVMMVRQPAVKGVDVVVAQSTMGDGDPNGAQSDPLLHVLSEEYAKGRAWLLPLAESVRAKIDWQKLYAAIGDCETKIKYDILGLVLYALHMRAKPDNRHLFCDAYLIYLLQQCGGLPSPAQGGMDPREASPQIFIDLPLFIGCQQIWGSPATIQFGKVG